MKNCLPAVLRPHRFDGAGPWLSRLGLFALLIAACHRLSAGTPQYTTPVIPADPDAAGRELVARLLALKPASGVTNDAVLHVRVNKTNQFELPVRIEVRVSETNWSTTYLTNPQNGANQTRFCIGKSDRQTNRYSIRSNASDSVPPANPSGADLMVPFAGSDFWLADLGMEFLHWPTQRLLSKELCRGQSCDKLESLAPTGWTQGYVRVVSWFDIDTGGPLQVQAYDAKGKPVKEFQPNKFKKVNGEWQVQELEISDHRTGSRTTLRFNLETK